MAGEIILSMLSPPSSTKRQKERGAWGIDKDCNQFSLLHETSIISAPLPYPSPLGVFFFTFHARKQLKIYFPYIAGMKSKATRILNVVFN